MLLTTALTVTAQNATFRIHGHIPGLKKGTTISVLKSEQSEKKSAFDAEALELGLLDFSTFTPEDNTIATATVAKDGEFLLEGTIDHPQQCTLITNNMKLIEKKTKGKSFDGIRWTYTPIFLSNDDFEIQVASYDKMGDEPITDEFRIVGGQPQNDFNDYNLARQKANIAENDDEAQTQLNLQFIQQHPTSVVSVYLASNMLTGGYNLRLETMNTIGEAITDCPADTARFNRYAHKLQLAKLTSVGAPLTDLDLNDTEGQSCRLSAVLPKSQLILVDFWASWCGICRASTPNIKQLYSQYPRDLFDVVSVSADSYEANWKKAMEADQMPWTQYMLTKQGYADFFEKYQVTGVPYYLLVNSDGRVIGSPARVSSIKEVIEAMKNK